MRFWFRGRLLEVPLMPVGLFLLFAAIIGLTIRACVIESHDYGSWCEAQGGKFYRGECVRKDVFIKKQ